MERKTESRVAHPPLQRIEEEPWSFLLLALAAGFAAGFLLRMKTVRKGLKLYAKVAG